jgi:EAL and modified HD-GYP domain-containing signal transduction protein
VIQACERLRSDGYRLALDDVVDLGGVEALLEHVDIVKVDFLKSTPEQRDVIADRLRSTPVKLLAEKVETHEAVDEAERLGYPMFQGFFFSRPVLVEARDVAPTRRTCCRCCAPGSARCATRSCCSAASRSAAGRPWSC